MANLESTNTDYIYLTRPSYSNNQFYEKSQNLCGGIFCFFYVIEQGWLRRGGKREGGCGEIFLKNCLSESHSLFPDFGFIFISEATL